MDGDEHGTHVSGIIAGQLEGGSASTNTGIAGVAPNVKIVPIKFLGPEGELLQTPYRPSSMLKNLELRY